MASSLDNWSDFREFTNGFAALGREDRKQFAFRGLPDSRWDLQTTLDRERRFKDDRERNGYYQGLLAEFELEVMKVDRRSRVPRASTEAFELVARHHGVPSPFLDWTQSPYIAAYFAFASDPEPGGDFVAIWVLDRNKMPPDDDELRVVDTPSLVRLNRRALLQKGLFLRVQTISRTIEDTLGDALTRVTLPVTARIEALNDLDLMSINATTLFDDLEGAARTARLRLSCIPGGK